MLMSEDGSKVAEKQQEDTQKMLAELKKIIEEKNELAKSIEQEPRKVLAKTYIEGTPSNLNKIISTMIGSYSFDSKGNSIPDRMIAVTLMVEDITHKK